MAAHTLLANFKVFAADMACPRHPRKYRSTWQRSVELTAFSVLEQRSWYVLGRVERCQCWRLSGKQCLKPRPQNDSLRTAGVCWPLRGPILCIVVSWAVARIWNVCPPGMSLPRPWRNTMFVSSRDPAAPISTCWRVLCPFCACVQGQR